ncbi:MAG: flagellar biosynthesis protein FlhB [Halothiobacillus sp.]|uniref:flagellar biosynthesis protein FlhB n=1 Tax=Halothiobacillus sp. TaxID=1891311 RepID=UPI002AD48332|nr:flagellar biosynthesis protein FlhB [Halothiobacillus sp.]MDA3878393.1 flagellar biosynthesis protein FlhB [Halothiobacillus sp.]
MAENENGQEKTEEPSAKRLRESREKGQVPRSRELNSLVITAGSAIVFLTMGGQMFSGMAAMMRQSFVLTRAEILDPATMFSHLGRAFTEGFLAFLPFFVATIVLAVAATLAVGGWNFSTEALLPQFNRLNPLPGFKRMFSIKSLVELLKTFAKFVLIGAIAVGLFFALEHDFVGLGMMSLHPALARAGGLLGWGFLGLSMGLFIVALIDVPFQIYEHNKSLRMTRQEVRDEYKETEGKPEVKQKIRQLQHQMSQRRMMEAVPTADVVITNPIHFSVALKYQPDLSDAPIVVAKGADEMALTIQKIAKANRVPLFEAPPLARSLYAHAEIDRPIPTGLYTAVAQVLAYIYQLRTAPDVAERPAPDVPSDLKVDAEARPANTKDL